MTMAGIPKSELTLKIPTTDLYALPPDASFHGKKGQANVDVKTQGDTLIVYASCDSLQRIVEWYESELTRIRSETVTGTETVQTEIKHRFNPVQMVLIAFIAGVASGMVLIIVIKKRNGKK